jgi:ferredoxin-NADP reductase
MAIIKKYRAEIISIDSFIDGVYTLQFKSLDKPFKYSPGQFLHIAIDADYDGASQWPESRCFSLQTSPEETDAKITYAVKGGFTRKMEQELKVGSEVWLKLPYGELFDQEHNKSKTVFIAGGTGVTPFLSLFTDESFKEYQNPKIYLGFRNESLHIYQDELNSVKAFENFVENCVTIFYEEKEGVIDINRIFDENGTDASYFISGPPVMIKLFKQALISRGVDATNILTDDWE